MFVPSLGIYVPSLGMYIPRLGMYVSSLGTNICYEEGKTDLSSREILPHRDGGIASSRFDFVSFLFAHRKSSSKLDSCSLMRQLHYL